MAKFTNELEVDVSKFLAGINKAQAAVEGLDESVTVKVDADASDTKSLTKGLNESAEAAREVSEASAEIGTSLEGATKQGAGLGGFFDGLKDKLGGLGGLGQAAAGGLSGIASAIPIPQVAAIGAAVGAVGAALGGIVEKGREAEEALKNLRLQTGASAEELAVLEEQASKAFQQGFGESVADSITQIGELKRALGDAVPDDFLGEAAAKANTFAKSIGVETPELVGKLSPLIKQYGLDFDEALNLVAQGAQKGVADIGGYLDAINEFTPNAKEAGLSAEEFAGRLQLAAEGGAKDLAKVGDGLKEINNRIKAGDLSVQVAEIAGDVGANLQEIARLGEEGTLSTQQVLEQSIQAIDKARAAGEINESTRGELFTLLGGSIAEDLGSELYSQVFGAPIDTDAIAANAEKAGATIADNLAKQDPLEKLSRTFDDFITDIGKGLVGFYNNFVAPIINPIIDGFIRIKEALANAFGGDALGDAAGIFETIKDVISGAVDVIVDRVATIVEVITETIGVLFNEIGDAVKPVIDAFGEFGDAGEGASTIFETLKGITATVAKVIKDVLAVAIKIVLTPLRLVGKAVAAFIGFVQDGIKWLTDAAVTVKEWALSFEPLKVAIESTVEFIKTLIDGVGNAIDAVKGFFGLAEQAAEDNAEATEDAKKNTKEWQKAVRDLIVAHQLTDEAIEDIAKQYNVATDEIRAFAEANSSAFLTAAKDVNQLASNFQNALTAAQSNLDKFLAAAAGGAKEFIAQARKAQTDLRKLEAQQDAVAFAIDPVRQAQVKAQRAAAAAETLKQARETTALLIKDAQEREAALLKIQQDADAESIESQIAVQKAIIAAGGAGRPEALAALQDLEEQKTRLLKQQEQDRLALEGQFQTLRLQQLQDAEQRARDAASAINDANLSALEKQLAALDLTGETLKKTIAAQTQQISAAAEAEVRAIVEGLPEFTKEAEEIARQVSAGLIDADAGKKQIDELRRSITDNLLAIPGGAGNAVADQIRAIFEAANISATDAARATADAFKDAGVAEIRSDIIRGIEEQVRGLEKQRDLLLQNVNLTAEQRAEIEQGYAAAIDKVRRGPVQSLYDSVLTISDALGTAVFDLEAESAAEDAEAVAKQVEEINALLAAGEITYQEALDRLRELETASEDTASAIGRAFSAALQGAADASNEIAQQSISFVNDLYKEREAVLNDTTLSAEDRANQVEAINGKIAESQGQALEQLAANAVLQFGSLLTESENAGEALKELAGATAQQLLALYTPTILGLFQSIIPPPFGLIAGTAAIGALNALLQAALAGFSDGGYTGNGGVNDIAGVVHGQEFVINANATRKHRDLLEAINSGASIDMLLPAKRGTGDRGLRSAMDNVASIMTDVRDRLDRIPDQTFTKMQLGVDVGLDDYLYEKQRHRSRVRNLR